MTSGKPGGNYIRPQFTSKEVNVLGGRGKEDGVDKEMEVAEEEEGNSMEVVDPVTEPKVKVVKNPGCPTKEEMDNHYVKHLPFRAWCPVCVEARACEDPHYKKEVK